ncbi:peptidoglycan bridge formation glycyltransferase FemA/FemB family protein [Candidatus Saccharibacteria bacterium]|nr:peptidoglycan bridge formation glycyltransferase FemA/FemB family protein [Candidatus Saccharibacteria bacterium]
MPASNAIQSKVTSSKSRTVTFRDATDRAAWDAFVTSDPTANFLQSWDFYEFHLSRGKQVVRRLALDDSGKLLAAYAGVVETAKRGTYLAIAGGPLLDWTDKPLIKKVFADIKEQGTIHHCTFVRVRPQLELSENSLRLMSSLGLRKAPMYLSVEYAGILDLHQSEAEILKNASQGFRRKLRKAEKSDIKIEVSAADSAIAAFCDLETLHAKRQSYVPFSRSFLEKQFAAFKKHNEVLIYTATKDNEILAMNFMIFYGPEASYHYGVSSELGTKYSAAPLLHLKAMAEARDRGIFRYNLWGIVDQDDTSHRFFGVSEFKRSFGCQELKYTPAHDLVLSPLKYQLTKVVETTRKKIRKV